MPASLFPTHLSSRRGKLAAAASLCLLFAAPVHAQDNAQISDDPVASVRARLAEALNRPPTNEEFEAFLVAYRDLVPLTPEMIRAMNRAVYDVEEAIASPPSGAFPEPKNAKIALSFDPSTAPATVPIYPGVVTTVSFYDETGAPWPIKTFATGQEDRIQSEALEGPANSIVLTPLAAHTRANMVVQLEGDDPPVTMTLAHDESEVVYNLSVELQARGPNAEPETARAPVLNASSPTIAAFAAGADIPKGARAVETSLADLEAWRLGGDLFLRSSGPRLVSPPWSATARAPGGVVAYRLPLSPVVMVSDGGVVQTIELDIGG